MHTNHARSVESRALEDMLRALPSAQQRRLGVELIREGPRTALIAPGLATGMFNRILGLAAEPSGRTQFLYEALARFRGCGAQPFVHGAAQGEDRGLSELCEEAGLCRYRRSWIKLRRPLYLESAHDEGGTGPGSVPVADTLVAIDRSKADEAAEVLQRGFALPEAAREIFVRLAERPHWRLVGMAHEGLIVAASALFLAEGSAYLAAAATRPEARGRGAQQRLIAERLRLARALGASEALTETGAARPGAKQTSQRNLERAGFQVVEQFDNWVLPGAAF